MKTLNSNLHQANKAKKDEFYTQLVDIEKEVKQYKKNFKNKVVLCNCDDPRVSNFFHYFSYNFEQLGLKKLIATCYKNQTMDLFSQHDCEKAIYLEYEGDKNDNKVPYTEEIGIKHLKGDGDFRSDECVELLKQADIVVTNPPFSLFREYVTQLMEYDKEFLIIGNINAITYKETFKLIKENQLRLGHGFSGGNAYFKTPYTKNFAKGVYNKETGLVKFRNVTWFTNLDITKRHEDLILYKQYHSDEYPKYDNYDTIELVKRFDTKKTDTKQLTFMDFCAGVGGGRLALDNLGMQCVGFSEIDKNAEKTYRLLFNDKGKNYGDLTKINADKLPDFDVMVAGFPCQAFSVLGKRKGIYDKVQKKGEIIFHLIEFLIVKSVKFFIFENVKGLIGHDNGMTLKIILDELDEAGYFVKWQMLNSIDYGTPQMRERIYFVGVKKELLGDNNFDFNFPQKLTKKSNVTDFLIDNVELDFNDKQQTYKTFQRYLENKYNKDKFSVVELLKEENLVIDTRQSDLRKYYNRVPTLRLGRHGILYVRNGKFRKLSGYESFLLQGFGKEKAQKARDNILDMHLLKQAGNAMTVSTVQAIAAKVLEFINNLERGNMNKKKKIGSKTAKDGFKNELGVVDAFNCWKTNDYAQKWLMAMDYHLEDIEYVEAHQISGYKADVQVEIKISIKLKHLTDVQNLQVKLVTNDEDKKLSGKNQIDKRWVETYQELWNIPKNVVKILKHFTGELPPYINNAKDPRRMFIDEFSDEERIVLFDFLKANQLLIVSDILKGRGKPAAEWMLVIVRNRDYKITHWALKSINVVCNYFGNGEIEISLKGSIKIGNILMQRKGGDGGRPSANMLQFNIDPTRLINI